MEKAITTTNTGTLQETRTLSFDLFNDFISFLDVSDASVRTYSNAVKQLFSFFQDNGITNPTYDDIRLYRDYLKQTRKPSTVQLYVVAIKQFFKWTAQRGIYPNIAEGVKGAKIDREHKRDYLTADAVKNVLHSIDTSTLQGKRDRALIALAVTAGLRTVELHRANIEDLATAGGNNVLFVQGKGHEEKAQYVKIPAQTEALLREYLATRAKAGYTVEPGDALFTSTSNHNQGDRMTTRSISRIVKEHLKEAGYNSDRLTAHSLRHSAVTLALLQGQDLAEVQAFARHRDISTTMIYNHAVDQAKNACGQAVADSIFV